MSIYFWCSPHRELFLGSEGDYPVPSPYVLVQFHSCCSGNFVLGEMYQFTPVYLFHNCKIKR